MKVDLMKISNIVIFFCFLLLNNVVFAETVQLPDNLNPAVIKNNHIETFQNKAEKLKNEYDNNSGLNSKLNMIMGSVEKEAPIINSEDQKFTVKKILFSGNTKIKDKDITELTSKYEGNEFTVEDLLNLCEQITAKYRDKGYITSKAVLLPQKVSHNEVSLTIDEGKYGDILVKGNKWSRTSYLKRVMKSYDIKEDSVLNLYDLKNCVALLNNSTYMQGDFSIEHSDEKNKSNLVLSVQDRYPLDFNMDWNNAGQEVAGRQRSVFTVSQNNLTGNGDALSLSGFLSKGTIGTFESYSIPIGSKGTKFVLGHSFSDTSYGGAYKAYGLKGKSQNFTIGLSQRLHQGEKWTVDSGITLDFGHIKQSMNEIGNLNDVHLTVLRTGIYGKREDINGLWLTNVTVNKSLPFMSRSGKYDYTNFVTLNAGVNRLQILPKRCYMLFNVNGQYSPDNLFSSEKMMLGGYNIRGYESASLLGDSGLYGTVELRTPVPFLKKILNGKFKEFEGQTKLGFFYDWGGAGDTSRAQNYLTGKSVNFLQSVGFGLHFPLGKVLTANIDFGIPLGESALISQSARVTFSITSNIHNLWCQKYNRKVKEPVL